MQPTYPTSDIAVGPIPSTLSTPIPEPISALISQSLPRFSVLNPPQVSAEIKKERANDLKRIQLNSEDVTK